MKINFAMTVVAVVIALSACSDDVLIVRVLPEQYEVGGVQSKLATPAVDATVRRNPSSVHIHVCPSTPPSNAIQFQTELAARYKGPISLALLQASQCSS